MVSFQQNILKIFNHILYLSFSLFSLFSFSRALFDFENENVELCYLIIMNSNEPFHEPILKLIKL